MTGVRTDDKGQIGEPWHDRKQCRNLIKKPWALLGFPICILLFGGYRPRVS